MILLFCSFLSSVPSFKGFAENKCYDKLSFPTEFVQGICYYFPSVKFLFLHIFVLQYDVFYDKLSAISVFLFL